VKWLGQLDGILSRSTGYDNLIAISSETRGRLPLGYLEEYASRAVAEHALLLAMALLRRLPQQMRQFPIFNRDGLTGAECEGKNLLVVGVGRIGTEIVNVAKGLGFIVKGVDIVPDKQGVVYTSSEEGIRWADVIICSMNLTEKNRGYFNYSTLNRAKRGCTFVNIARGELSPLGDLDRLLDQSKISGLGLDVFEDEGSLGAALRNPGVVITPQADQVRHILSYPNVLLTPHNAFNSGEALQRKSELTIRQIRHFLKHRDFLWKV
jgi:D-lactate dehydrogenase